MDIYININIKNIIYIYITTYIYIHTHTMHVHKESNSVGSMFSLGSGGLGFVVQVLARLEPYLSSGCWSGVRDP